MTACPRCPALEAQLAEARAEAADYNRAWQILDEPNSGLRIHTGETAADVARAFVDSRSLAIADRDRLRKLFDDAGRGEHNVLALVDHYQSCVFEAEADRDAARAAVQPACDAAVDAAVAAIERERDDAYTQRDAARQAAEAARAEVARVTEAATVSYEVAESERKELEAEVARVEAERDSAVASITAANATPISQTIAEWHETVARAVNERDAARREADEARAHCEKLRGVLAAELATYEKSCLDLSEDPEDDPQVANYLRLKAVLNLTPAASLAERDRKKWDEGNAAAWHRATENVKHGFGTLAGHPFTVALADLKARVAAEARARALAERAPDPDDEAQWAERLETVARDVRRAALKEAAFVFDRIACTVAEERGVRNAAVMLREMAVTPSATPSGTHEPAPCPKCGRHLHERRVEPGRICPACADPSSATPERGGGA